VPFSAGERLAAMLSVLAATLSFTGAQDTKELVNREVSKPAFRGAIVFKTYCGRCHGERGDGMGRAELAIAPHPPKYYETIIRGGGHTVGRSSYMPPWQDELSQEQIGDVVAYVTIVGDTVRRGEAVYKTNCILCHGVQGDGKGRAATLFHPPPADLTRSEKDDEYKTAIILKGGEGMGRSSGMPPWEGRLTNVEINDLVKYLRTFVATPPDR
jgi:cytochrome c oxidase cbb3-type subunit III